MSGGGILGAAHLGVVAELDAMGLRPDILTGTSAGGLVALSLAAGVGVDALTAFGARVCRHPLEYFRPQVVRVVLQALPFDPRQPATGLLDPAGFVAGLAALASGRTALRDLERPCAATSVDLRSLDAVAFVGGLGAAPAPAAEGWQALTGEELSVALWATMAEPVLFMPLERPPRLYADGGVADTLPVDWAMRLGSARVLAVDVATPGPAPRRFDICSVVQRSEAYATRELSALRVPPAAQVLTLQPRTAGVGFPGLKAYPRLVAAGQAAVRERAEEIRRFLAA